MSRGRVLRQRESWRRRQQWEAFEEFGVPEHLYVDLEPARTRVPNGSLLDYFFLIDVNRMPS